ncbi:hypothetical protein [Dyella subtropica]|uniref:hypothetical protein n=1 Tax=Dyella subtropica TaxID=2992127 RepID=UPI0022559792|nr:hypothetical protein [Dyella subtropica]
MAKTRQDLEMMLAELDAAIPRLLAEYPDPNDFWPNFNSLAAEAVEDAGAADESGEDIGTDDHAWVCEQLDNIMARHHLVPPPDQI